MSKFAYEANERLYPEWMLVMCEMCGVEHALISNPQKPCVMCRLRAQISERKWPDDFRGFHTNVKPKKQ